MLPLLLALACRHEPAPAAPPSSVVAEAPAAVEPPPAPSSAFAEGATPASVFAGCRDRMELPEVAGECKADADCATAGCGSEVCTSTASAKDVMTTCEVLPCFQVVDACGCHEGKCSWTLDDALPTLRALPPRADDVR
jgi:eight-cysteine-cluster-containing protein